MNDIKKAKWLIGASAVLLSAGLLSQLNDKGAVTDSTPSNNQQVKIDQSKVSKKEKELLQLDWTNFEITKATTVKKDRQTRRS